MRSWLGIDGGGTKTHYRLQVEACRESIDLTSGPMNWSRMSSEEFQSSLKAAGRSLPTPKFVYGCFAGILTSEDSLEVLHCMKHVWPEALVRCGPDFEAALAACKLESTACVIAGTGSIVVSYAKGLARCSGGGGPFIGDCGSAFDFGRKGVRYLLEAEVSDHTEIYRLAKELYGEIDSRRMLRQIYQADQWVAQIARLAKAVAEDAVAGEDYAVRSFDDNLARTTASHLRTHHNDAETWDVTLAGGLWDVAPIFAQDFSQRLKSMTGDQLKNVELLAEAPVAGAVKLAQQIEI